MGQSAQLSIAETQCVCRVKDGPPAARAAGDMEVGKVARIKPSAHLAALCSELQGWQALFGRHADALQLAKVCSLAASTMPAALTHEVVRGPHDCTAQPALHCMTLHVCLQADECLPSLAANCQAKQLSEPDEPELGCPTAAAQAAGLPQSVAGKMFGEADAPAAA